MRTALYGGLLPAIPNPRSGLLCLKCAGPDAEDKTISLGGLLRCERCGVIGIQTPGWTHRIGLFESDSAAVQCGVP